MNDSTTTTTSASETIYLTQGDTLLQAADIIIRHISREMTTERFKSYEAEDVKVFQLVRIRAEFLRSLFDGPSRQPAFYPEDIARVLEELDYLKSRNGGISVTHAINLVKAVDDMILAYYRAILHPVPTGFWHKLKTLIRPA